MTKAQSALTLRIIPGCPRTLSHDTGTSKGVRYCQLSILLADTSPESNRGRLEEVTDFWRCIEAFGESNYQVVMLLGNRLSPEELGNILANFIVRSYVPQTEVLERADLFITHGGANSVHQALYHSVPMLFYPQQVEQALVAARIAELGAGYLVREPLSVATLRSVTNLLLDNDSYHKQAAALGASLKSAGGVQKAADAVVSFATRH